MKLFTSLSLALFLLVGCGSLEKKSILIGLGDTMERVIEVMGMPDDRQIKDRMEAWQYCKTGAGFGYHDYRMFWFYEGRASGITSYKTTRPGTSCMADIREVNWEEAPSIQKD